jgi:hypothetical protein
MDRAGHPSCPSRLCLHRCNVGFPYRPHHCNKWSCGAIRRRHGSLDQFVHRAGDDARTLACPNTLAPGMARLRLQGSLRFDMFMIAPLGVAAISFHSIMARSAPSCRAPVPRGVSLLSGAQYGVRLERLRYRATPVIAVCSGSIAALIAATCVCASP